MLTDEPAPPLLNISKFAKRMTVTRQTVWNWLGAGKCPVAPIVGTKPPKWRTTDVDAYLVGEADA